MRLMHLVFALVMAFSSTGALAEDWCRDLAGLKASPPTWVATDADTTVVLIAAIHVLPPRTKWRLKGTGKLMDSADELILDTKIEPKAAVAATFAKHAFDRNLPPIQSRLRADLQPALAAEAARLKVPATTFDRMKTWAVSFLVMGGRPGSCELGMAFKLESEFARKGRRVTGLETQDTALADFDALPERAQSDLLEQALNSPNDEQYRAMIRSWAAGDLAASAAAAQADLGKSPAVLAMLARQRARLGAALIRLMAVPGTKVAVLGALYFDGPNSIVEQLQRSGFNVRRVQ